ncbi:MAG: glycosyltransferase family 4 protein [Chlorobi bacterium]|nr:glycosyltransferase family 4 protein [Chlorobiota bacterium]
MAHKPVIVVNGRFLAQRFSGAQMYAYHLLDNARRLPLWKELYWILAVPEQAKIPQQWHFAFDEIRMKGSMSRNPWDHLILPSLVPQNALLVNLSSMPSLRVENQLFCLHDVLPFIMPDAFNPLSRPWYRWLYKRSVKKFPFIVVSDYLKRMAMHLLGKNPINVIYPAGEHIEQVDETPIYNPLPDKYVLVIGGNVAYRPIQPVIDALKILRNIGIDIHLVYSQSSNKLLFSIQRNHEDYPWIHRIDLPSSGSVKFVMKRSIAVVVPSIDEAFGIPVLEASLSGVPVIVSQAPGLSESGTPCLRFPVDNPEILAQHILTLMKDKHFRHAYVNKCKQHAKQFSWKASAQKLLETISLTIK